MFRRLSLENFRIFEALSLHFDDPSVVISGSNGQGKTSVLEAIFFLASLRSFRTSRLREMRRIGSDSFRLACELDGGRWNTTLAVESGETRKLMLDGVPVCKASDFTGRVNTIAFLPDDPAIISGAALLRRRFFDMFISMLDREYFTALQLYSGALKQRNYLLRMPGCDEQILQSYHPIIAENGSLIVQKRREYVRMLSEFMRNILAEIRPEFKNFSIRMRYSRECENMQTYLDRLNSKVQSDTEKGFTAIGPHLDDFDFTANEKNLRIYGSNGQKRIVSFAMKMAEYDIVASHSENGKNTIVIVDDATGDLDYKTKNAFFEKIRNAGQVFYAFTDIGNDPVFKRSQIITLSNGKAIQS